MHASVIYVRIVMVCFKGAGHFEPLPTSVGRTMCFNNNFSIGFKSVALAVLLAWFTGSVVQLLVLTIK